MLNLKRFSQLLLISLISIGLTFAQNDLPPAAGNVKKIAQKSSLKDLSADQRFSSVDGRFLISLPSSISGYTAITPQNAGLNASGSLYSWRVREGIISVWYMDLLEKNFNVKSEQDYVDYFAGVIDGSLNTLNAKLISSAKFNLEKNRGIKINILLPDSRKGVYINILVGNRQYVFLGIFAPDVVDAESLVNKAFDSFALVNQNSIDADLKRRIEASTPAPLPQTPVSQKLRSDAEDDNLKGKIKNILEESEDLSGTWSMQGRHNSSITDYNEQGNRLKKVHFDSKANPFEITVYGYIDGARVSKSKSVSYEYNPPAMIISAAPPDGKVENKSDPRYGYKLDYKYVDGNLSEMQMIRSGGEKGLRYIYNRNGNQLEKLVYDEAGKLNQKYLSTLDEKGNEIERTDVDIFSPQLYGDRKYTTKYEEFDANGNWTKKTTLKLVNENGKQVYKNWYITYRTITYY